MFKCSFIWSPYINQTSDHQHLGILICCASKHEKGDNLVAAFNEKFWGNLENWNDAC